MIKVNSVGNYSSDCCIHGDCICGSFPNALQSLENNSIINITSPSVSLHGYMRLANLTNVTISGNGATIMCNNSGIITCVSCSNFVIDEIVWDQCGNTNHPKYTHAIGFIDVSNLTILSSAFQYSGACIVIGLSVASGNVEIRDSKFLYNHVVNSSRCLGYSSLLITDNEFDGSPYTISIAGTTFHHNGMFNNNGNPNSAFNDVLSLIVKRKHKVDIVLINSNVSASGSLGISFTCTEIDTLTILLYDVTIVNNSEGGSFFNLVSTDSYMLVSSSTFAHNSNGALIIINNARISSEVHLERVSVFHNNGTFAHDLPGNLHIDEGVGIYLWLGSIISLLEMSSCNIYNNVGGQHSIVYIKLAEFVFSQKASIISTNFTNNVGPTLHISSLQINLEGFIVYQDNTGDSGVAIYIEDNSQVVIGEGSTILFINNSASLHGGAIYVDLPLTCSHHGVVFTSLPNNSDVVFINNSAGITGNSMYFSIPESCDVIRDYNDSNSIGYIPYKFSYSGFGGTEISTSPYQINLCSSPGCDSVNTNNCFIQHGNMLGQSINFNATVCDYFNNVAETVQFNMECINCNNTYRLYNTRVLAHDGLSEVTVASVDSDSDLHDNINITINMSSVLPHKYKQLTATVSIELSSCHSGFVFETSSQQCTCYSDSDIIQCLEQYTEIKQGYWFGSVIERHTVSLCPQYYCDFGSRAATRTGYYQLPANQDDQCSPHRRGPSCGECSPGYSLSYDTPDCVSNDKCSTGITVLVVALTLLYWIAVVVVIFVLMYFINNAPIGYAYGIIYYYSVVDILLGNHLYISDGVFQFISILSSLAKLTPQFLGRLCFVEGLSGIDQQFIRFSHATAVLLLVVIVIVAARYSATIAKLVSRCIIRVICLLLLLAYTSLATTSLQLLRPLHYQDVDGVYVYFSPSNKYFSGRHVVYAIIAICFEIFIVQGLILFLLFEPCLKKRFNLNKMKPCIDQLQACYKDKCYWCAAYYLVCRQVIILIVYINTNYDTALYCLQTFCIITVAIHVWIQPYKSTTLNVIDTLILLTMVLVVNLSTFSFSRSLTIALVVVMVNFPWLFAFSAYLKNNFHALMTVCYQRQKNFYQIRSNTDEAETKVTASFCICAILSNHGVY